MKIVFANHLFEIEEINPSVSRYSKDLECKCGFSKYTHNAIVVGFSSTDYGFMAVFECPKCYDKYRHHINTVGRYDVDRFKMDIGLILYRQMKVNN